MIPVAFGVNQIGFRTGPERFLNQFVEEKLFSSAISAMVIIESQGFIVEVFTELGVRFLCKQHNHDKEEHVLHSHQFEKVRLGIYHQNKIRQIPAIPENQI
jgi:hypothetical protein